MAPKRIPVDNTTTDQGAKRWLRVGTLTLTLLGPAINALIARWQERSSERQAEEEEVASKKTILTDPQEKLAAINTALIDVLSDLKEHPYSQELVKRGEELTAELVERGNKLSHSLTDYGEQLTHDITKRSNKAKRVLVKRSKQTKKALRKAVRTQAKDNNDSMKRAIVGFSIGLVAATGVVFLFIRKRMQQQALDEEQHFQLARNEEWGSTYNGAAYGGISTGPVVANVRSTANQPQTSTNTSAQSEITGQRTPAPADALFVGVVSQKLYYPVETPLDQLAPTDNETVDVVYFVSEHEAREQGFSLASTL